MHSKVKGGVGEWPWGVVTTDHIIVCLEAAVRSESCVSVLGWERPIPDCRAVREQRLSVK